MGDEESKSQPSASSDTDKAQAEDGKKSGRVTFDSRGNSVWEWQMKTGVFGRDIDTKRLKKLEDQAHLSIADDEQVGAGQEKSPAAGPTKKYPGKPAPGGGFNPYDHSAGSAPAPRTDFDPLNRPLKEKPDAAKPKKPGLLRRLFGRS